MSDQSLGPQIDFSCPYAIAATDEVNTTFLTPASLANFNALRVPSSAGRIRSSSFFGSSS